MYFLLRNKILHLPVYMPHKVEHHQILALSFRARQWGIYRVFFKNLPLLIHLSHQNFNHLAEGEWSWGALPVGEKDDTGR